jgi:hypothetical protein
MKKRIRMMTVERMKTNDGMRQVQKYNTLDELRAEKAEVSRRLGKGVEKLQSDIVESFVPENSLLDSAFSYIRYVGYAMTAFKTARTVMNAIAFMRRRKWF